MPVLLSKFPHLHALARVQPRSGCWYVPPLVTSSFHRSQYLCTVASGPSRHRVLNGRPWIQDGSP